MNYSDELALKLVGMTYDAALDERKWPSFLQAFARAVDSKSASLRLVDFQIAQVGFSAHVGSYTPAMLAAYTSYFIKLDYYPKFYEHAPLMHVDTDQNGARWGFSPAYQRKTEYFNDFIRRNGHEYAMGTVLARDGNQTLHFATQRGKRAGKFGEEQQRLMSILAPHVARAVQVHRKISSVTVDKEWALGALDQLRMCVILTNSSGIPMFANRAAEQMLTVGDGINTHYGKLVLSNPTETARLYQLIGDASQGAPESSMGADMRVTLCGGDFLHCMVMPIPVNFTVRWNIGLASGCVALFLSKPDALQLPPERLAVMYGLTPAEGKLASKLAALRSLEQAADDLCISIHTARTQLRSIFAKTDVQSQSKLLLLFATGTLAHCGDVKRV